MSSFPCEKKKKKIYTHVFDDCWKTKTWRISCAVFTGNQACAIKYGPATSTDNTSQAG